MTIDALRIAAEASERGYFTAAEAALMREYRSRPAPAEDVPPSLRFMLAPEAIAEAGRYSRYLRDVTPFSERAEIFAETVLVGGMEERWPWIARADRAVGGLVCEVLRKAARERGRLPGWEYFANGLAIGHPQNLEATCLGLLGWRSRHGEFAEEAPDPLLVRHGHTMTDRDVPEADLVDDACPF